MIVPFLDVGAAYRELKLEIDAAVSRVLESGCYIGGDEVTAFEREYADFCEAQYCVGVGNGLDALILALRALDVGCGDEVIVPSNTYIATWLAVSAVGAIPVPVEPNPATFNIDPDCIEDAITPHTRAILPVHLYGRPAELDAITMIARRHNMPIIEDAAQAHGARYKGRRIGGHSDIVCWSFYPGKNLGALGDAGAITTNDAGLAARVRRLGNYGSDKKYVNVEHGVNSRLDPIQAAVLRVKLAHLDDWNARRCAVVSRYAQALTDTSLILPGIPDGDEPVWHLYVVRAQARDALLEHFRRAGISTLIHYPIPPHKQSAYADLRISKGALPIAESLADEVLSLPIGPHLSIQEQDAVVAVATEVGKE